MAHKVVLMDYGVGDVVMSTPLIRCMKQQYPEHKLIVACIYAEILKGNPNIDFLYQLGTLNDMYSKWIRPLKDPKDYMMIKPYEPRLQYFYDEPMSKLFCDLAGVKFDKDVLEFFLTKEEENFGKQLTAPCTKPIVVLQIESARVSLRGGEKMITEKDWFNDRWDTVVDVLKKDYDFVQVGGKDEYRVKGTKMCLLGKTNYRESAAILKNAHTFVTIDSAVSHIGPSVGTTGIVLFGRSKISTLGHTYNTNIEIKVCPDQPCLRPEPASGDLEVKDGNNLGNWTCKDRICMKAITPDVVIKAIKEFKPGKIQ